MTKIVLIGAGSGFGARFCVDIMSSSVLRDATICLCDLHEGRLEAVRAYAQRMIDTHGLPTRLVCATDRKELLPGADFVVTSIAAGGGAYYGEPFRSEIEIPLRYGIDQAVGDSYSVGATFRFLRTAPVQLAICRDMEALCPNALLLNHTNPMSALTMVHSMGSSIRNVGLCHGVIGTADRIAAALRVDPADMHYRVAGMNHLAFFLELTQKSTGEDLYPRLRAFARSEDDEQAEAFRRDESVRVEMLNTFGFFPTEGNRHDSEYLPYFRRTPELMQAYSLKSRGPIPDAMYQERAWQADGQGKQQTGELKPSREYTIPIMEALLTDTPFLFSGNVMNDGLLDDFPRDLCVEVPCVADAHGVSPLRIGKLPTAVAGLDRALIAPVQLAVEAVLEKNREKAFQAVAEDWNVAALLSLSQARALFEEMWAAQGDLMNWFVNGEVVERCAPN